MAASTGPTTAHTASTTHARVPAATAPPRSLLGHIRQNPARVAARRSCRRTDQSICDNPRSPGPGRLQRGECCLTRHQLATRRRCRQSTARDRRRPGRAGSARPVGTPRSSILTRRSGRRRPKLDNGPRCDRADSYRGTKHVRRADGRDRQRRGPRRRRKLPFQAAARQDVRVPNVMRSIARDLSTHPEHDAFVEQVDEFARVVDQLRTTRDRRTYTEAQTMLADLHGWLKQRELPVWGGRRGARASSEVVEATTARRRARNARRTAAGQAGGQDAVRGTAWLRGGGRRRDE